MGISFTVLGSPVGAVRTTQRGKWCDPAYQKYLDYKCAVVQRYCEAGGIWDDPYQNKPIKYNRKVKPVVKVFCWFDTANRPDCDNVFKAVTDALFLNDTNVVGSVDYGYDLIVPRIEVEISYEQAPDITKARQELKQGGVRSCADLYALPDGGGKVGD